MSRTEFFADFFLLLFWENQTRVREKASHVSRDLLHTLTATPEIYKTSHQMAHLTLTLMHGLLQTPATITRTHFPLYLLPHVTLNLPTISHGCCWSITLKPSWLNKTKMFEVNQLSWSVIKNSISTEMYIGMDTEQTTYHQHWEKNAPKQPSFWSWSTTAVLSLLFLSFSDLPGLIWFRFVNDLGAGDSQRVFRVKVLQD